MKLHAQFTWNNKEFRILDADDNDDSVVRIYLNRYRRRGTQPERLALARELCKALALEMPKENA